MSMAHNIKTKREEKNLKQIGTAAKPASILGVSLNYLMGNSDMEMDTETLLNLQEVDKLSGEDKKMVLRLLRCFYEQK